MTRLIGVIASKWAMPVLYNLLRAPGPVRFTVLRRSIGRVTQRELSLTLKRFEEIGVVHRKVFPEVPPRVEYRLTPLGRSLAYRCGAFHHLAHQAWRGALPAELAPAQVRSALTAVIRRTLDTDGTLDAEGWLRVGLAGHQPALAEPYISTGSLYLCTFAFHPLGLPASAR